MEEFINEFKLNPLKEKEDLFIKSFKLSKDDLDSMLFLGMVNLNTNITLLEKQVQRMHRFQFESFIQKELESLQQKYPSGKPIQFELFILDENDDFIKDKLGGVSAFTDWEGKMCFIVYPNEKIRSTLKSEIVHEYHHHWRIAKLGISEDNQTLLDRMILEGLAEHFVGVVLGDACLGPYKEA
ncbi:DUF2268 domain-containing putative Zn-dependent protease [Fictibacillus terranigra]|uniref:DUF2268 domain-containing putative Zn-dependent protease n=1 Tax=Fictibacillus terranigra TaxID=3058424 RepID=A0ABT8EDW8_9BACL|nr:DUF2268 domain-containing putative Zn-dependent protease [Fictibacillus sp. CENA-BCM004]MDN4076062.1 DUF2268 domain-containing putative Zn-dependent protease [Fictibacillus sp. CENA-BCM004]